MANIQKLLGDKFKEGMTAEEQLAALEEVSLPKDNSDELVRLKNANDKLASEAAENKRKLKEHMSEEEKRSAEEAERIQAMENENKALKRQFAISDYTGKFIASGLDQKTAAECAEAAYEGNIDTIISHFNTKIASVKDEVKAQLISETPNLTGGKSASVKDYSNDIADAINGGDFAKAAALTRVAQQNTNND